MFRISILSIFFVLQSCISASAQNIIYVNINATGNQSGTDWGNAFTSLNDALASSESGDEIWVAKGAYKPTLDNDRTASFDLKNGVKLYGGFSGNETQVTQRDFSTNQTILSGEIGDLTTLTDNSFSVVRAIGLDSTSILDGFFIRNGYSYGTNQANRVSGAGMLLTGSSSLNNSQPLIINCTFENNHANFGGGMAIIGINAGKVAAVNPKVINCLFNKNSAQQKGGGIYKIGPSPNAPMQMERCTLKQNRTFGGPGGGLAVVEATNASLNIKNCTFERDSALLGGGIYIDASEIPGSSIEVLIDSCIIDGNYAIEGAGLCYDGLLTFVDSLKIDLTIQNCIFRNNLSFPDNGSAFLIFTSDKSTLNSNIINCQFVNNKTDGNYLTWISVASGSNAIINFDKCYFNNNYFYNSVTANCFPIFLNNALTYLGSNTILSKISNCIFDRNGGGVIVLSQPQNYTDVDIVNCTFYGNKSPQFVRNNWDSVIGDYRFNYRIRNSIIWEYSNIWNIFYTNDPDNINLFGFDMDYCDIRIPVPQGPPGWWQAFGDNMHYWVEPMFVDSTASDFRLLPCSPLVNIGDNDIVENLSLLQDLEGMERIKNNVVDFGAHETVDTCKIVNVFESEYSSGTSQKLAIWNNPSANGSISFGSPANLGFELATLTIFDIKGGLKMKTYVLLQDQNEVNIEALTEGCYFVRLGTSIGTFWNKLIVL